MSTHIKERKKESDDEWVKRIQNEPMVSFLHFCWIFDERPAI